MRTNTTKRRPAVFAAVILAAALLAGCKGDVLDYRNAQVVNGKIYSDGANSPFTGSVTNIPNGQILASQQGFRKLVSAVETVLPHVTVNYLDAAGLEFISTVPDAPSAVYCDVHASDGYLDGRATCKGANTDEVRMEMTFKGGRLDGKLTVYAPQSDKAVLAETTFRDGELDGKQNIYSPTTHRLVHSTDWTHGQLTGTEEGFDGNTGNRILLATLLNGKYDGAFTQYAPDGKQVVYRTTYAAGAKVGTEEAFDPQTGKLTGHAEYSNGQLNGVVKRWNADGKLIFETAYQNGQEIPDPAVAACVNQRDVQHQSQEGENISALYDEWGAGCREALHGPDASVNARSSASADSDNASTDAEITDAIRTAAKDSVGRPGDKQGAARTCVDQWTSAYRKENGADAIVAADQITEWQSWCQSGKRPD